MELRPPLVLCPVTLEAGRKRIFLEKKRKYRTPIHRNGHLGGIVNRRNKGRAMIKGWCGGRQGRDAQLYRSARSRALEVMKVVAGVGVRQEESSRRNGTTDKNRIVALPTEGQPWG
jgi:hypothetical protein